MEKVANLGGRRALQADEVKLTERSLKVSEEELSHLEFLEKHNKLMLDEGLESNYKEKVREFKKNGQTLVGEIKFMKEKIDVMNDQLKNGVEVKEKKSPVGVD